MYNEPFLSNTNPEPFHTPRKTPNPKVIGIGTAVAVVLIIAGIILLIPKETPVRAGEFNDDATSTREVPETREYVDIEDFELEGSILTASEVEEVEDKLTTFFTYAYPEISSLSVKDLQVEEYSSPAEVTDEENPGEEKTYKYTLVADNGSKFIAEIETSTNVSGYSLLIKNSNNEGIYSYKSGSITSDLYDHSFDDLVSSAITFLPLTATTAEGEEFEITFEGDEDDVLFLSAVSEEETLRNCDAAKTAAIEKLKSLPLEYSGSISENDFVCE